MFAEFVVWSMISSLHVERAAILYNEDRDNGLDHTIWAAIMFSLPLRTIAIVKVYGVKYIIDQVCLEPAPVLAAYE